MSYTLSELSEQLKKLSTQVEEMQKEILELKNQSLDQAQPTKKQNELILAQTNELIVASSKQVAKEVYGKIISHINTEVAPKVNSMMEYISLATEDGSESTEMYQRGVEHRSQQRNPHAGLIEMGAVSEDSHPYISPYVSLGIRGK